MVTPVGYPSVLVKYYLDPVVLRVHALLTIYEEDHMPHDIVPQKEEEGLEGTERLGPHQANLQNM